MQTGPVCRNRLAREASVSGRVHNHTSGVTIEAFGEEVTEGVGTVTFSGGEVEPGEFVRFPFSVGPVPAGEIEVKAIQTYDSGEVVRWIGPADGDEPALTRRGPLPGRQQPVQPRPQVKAGKEKRQMHVLITARHLNLKPQTKAYAEQKAAKDIDVSATPSFLINGKHFVGARPAADLRARPMRSGRSPNPW